DRVLVFDLPSGREVARTADLRRVSDVRFLTDDVLLLTHFGGCFRWDLRRGGRELLSEQGWQSRTAVSPDGQVVAIGTKAGLVLFDVVLGKVRRHLECQFAYGGDGYSPQCPPAFSADGRYVAADLHGDQRGPHFVVVWDAHT